MNADALNVLSTHPYTTAGVIGALGVIFALTSNVVKTIEGFRSLFRKKEPDKEPTKEDVRNAGIPAFGKRARFAQGIATGAGFACFGATVADAAFHGASHAHDAASTVADHVGAVTDHAVHSGIASHVAGHADSLWDVVTGVLEAIFS
jgi:hypothetical protein